MEKGSSGKRMCPHEIDFFEKKILTNQKTFHRCARLVRKHRKKHEKSVPIPHRSLVYVMLSCY